MGSWYCKYRGNYCLIINIITWNVRRNDARLTKCYIGRRMNPKIIWSEDAGNELMDIISYIHMLTNYRFCDILN